MIVVRTPKGAFLLDCPFDHELDDYPDAYRVYEIPDRIAADLLRDWSGLPGLATYVGDIAVEQITFDATRRRTLRSASLERFLAGDIRER